MIMAGSRKGGTVRGFCCEESGIRSGIRRETLHISLGIYFTEFLLLCYYSHQGRYNLPGWWDVGRSHPIQCSLPAALPGWARPILDIGGGRLTVEDRLDARHRRTHFCPLALFPSNLNAASGSQAASRCPW